MFSGKTRSNIPAATLRLRPQEQQAPCRPRRSGIRARMAAAPGSPAPPSSPANLRILLDFLFYLCISYVHGLHQGEPRVSSVEAVPPTPPRNPTAFTHFEVGVTHPKLAGEEPAPSLARGGAQRRMGCGPLLRSRSHCATVTAKLQPIIPAFHTPCGPSGHLPRFAEKGGSSAACRLDGLCERGSPQPETTDRAVKSMKKHSSWRMGLSSVETASRAVLRTRCAVRARQRLARQRQRKSAGKPEIVFPKQAAKIAGFSSTDLILRRPLSKAKGLEGCSLATRALRDARFAGSSGRGRRGFGSYGDSPSLV